MQGEYAAVRILAEKELRAIADKFVIRREGLRLERPVDVWIDRVEVLWHGHWQERRWLVPQLTRVIDAPYTPADFAPPPCWPR
jgi:hypothetical protein